MSVHLSMRPEEAQSFTNESFDTHRFAEFLDALQAPATIPAIRDLANRIQHLNTMRVRIVDRQDLSDRVHNAVLRVLPQLEADLNHLHIPLLSEKRSLYNLADELLAAAASSYQCLLKEQSRRLFGLASSGRALVPVQRIMMLLSRRICLAYRIYAPPPKGTWHALHELYQFAARRGLADRVTSETFISPAVLYKRALLAAFAGTSRLERRERKLAGLRVDIRVGRHRCSQDWRDRRHIQPRHPRMPCLRHPLDTFEWGRGNRDWTRRAHRRSAAGDGSHLERPGARRTGAALFRRPRRAGPPDRAHRHKAAAR